MDRARTTNLRTEEPRTANPARVVLSEAQNENRLASTHVESTGRDRTESGVARKAAAKPTALMTFAAMIPFLTIHAGAITGLFLPMRAIDWIVCGGLYAIRMFAITGFYHRYFSHRTFKTSRAFQFLMAFVAQTSSQKGCIWWSVHHRHHHKYSDTEIDVHSPVQSGFWYSHLLWMFESKGTDYSKAKDLAKYPELVWLDRLWALPPIVLGFVVWITLGWSGLFIGFMMSTVFTWHSTFTINSLAHQIGGRRFETTDDSRNNFFLALLTFGEGWHNNHHRYMTSARQGFYWWEIDLTYYGLVALSKVGLIWDLRPVPVEVLEEGRQKARSSERTRAAS